MKIRYTALSLILFGLGAAPAFAGDIMVPAAMQRCNDTSECVFVANTCGDPCPRLPVNEVNIPTISQTYKQTCGQPLDQEAAMSCSNPVELEPACINGRCTIKTAYENHGSAGDYQSGAYPLPEGAVPYQGSDDYSHVNDTDGNFTAYDLPKDIVRKNSMGE